LSTAGKIIEVEQLGTTLAVASRPLVFTNGCFDILHRGHVNYLEEAAELGQSLLIAVNTDDSVRRLGKGTGRPINSLDDRMAVLAALACVDFVVPFDEETPLEVIRKVRPDFLVKGGDWAMDSIVGASEVRAYGGEVRSIPIRFQRSTTELIAKLKSVS